MDKNKILEKYRNVPIGKDNLNRDIFSNEISKKEDLMIFLYNVYGPQDESLTKEGLKFLEEFYGLDEVAEFVLEGRTNGLDYCFENKKDVLSWLNQVVNL